MARINELMSQGMAAPVARMLGVNSIASVPAGGTTQATATPLPINFAVLTSQSATAGVLLPTALGGGISVYYNSGPSPLLIYPFANEAFQDANVNLPLTLQVHGTAVLIPSGNCWLAALTAPPGFTTPPVPGGAGGQIQVNSGGSFVGMPAVSGDGLLNTGTGIFTLTGLAGHSLLATQPNQGDVLTWSAASNAWGPSPGVPGPVGPIGPVGPAGPTGAPGSVIVSATPPVTTQQGQLWWSSTDGQLYLWFTDQNSSQYVIANSTPGGLGTAIPDAPNDGNLYGRQSLAWHQIITGGTITGVTAGNGLTGGGTVGTVTVGLAAPVSVANGGTGVTTLPTGQLLQGNGTSAVTGIGLPLGVAQGGTGQSGMTPGQLIRAAGTATAPFLASTINDIGLGVTIGKTVGGAIPNAAGTAGALALAGPLIVNANAGTLPANPANALLRIGGADATSPTAYIDSYGTSVNPSVTLRGARGTGVAPTAVQLNDVLGTVVFSGYNGTNYAFGGQLYVYAAENWTATNHGTNLTLALNGLGGAGSTSCAAFTPTSATLFSNATALTLQTGIQLGSPTGGDQGANTINVAGAGYFRNGRNVTPGQVQEYSNHIATIPSPVSTPGAMIGLGYTVAPVNTGRVLIILSGAIAIAATATTMVAFLQYGTGTPPANGAAGQLGTNAGAAVQCTEAANTQTPCTLVGIISGLTLGTTYWIDVYLQVNAGTGNGNFFNTSLTYLEV